MQTWRKRYISYTGLWYTYYNDHILSKGKIPDAILRVRLVVVYIYIILYYYQFLSGTWVAQKAGPANVLPRVQKHIHIQVAITTYTHTLWHNKSTHNGQNIELQDKSKDYKAKHTITQNTIYKRKRRSADLNSLVCQIWRILAGMEFQRNGALIKKE